MTPAPTAVFFDARAIRPGMTGVGRATLALLRALAELRRADPSRLGLRAAVLASSLEAVGKDSSLAGVVWEPTSIDYESHPWGDIGLRFRLARRVRRDEVYHGPAFIIPGGGQPFPRVATIHDLGVFARPEDFPPRFAKYLRWRIGGAVAKATRLIVPTAAVAAELAERYPRARGRLRVVPDAPIVGPDPWGAGSLSAAPSFRWPPGGYFLTVGTFESRKDPLTAAQALARLGGDPGGGAAGPEWIWVGAPGHRADEINRGLAALPLGGRFRAVGAQKAEVVGGLMAGALAFIYPSRYEGFGLPPLEAMARGTPVIASDLPALREVLGEGALYFPPGDAAALASVLNRLIFEPGLREGLRQRGRARAEQFKWSRTGEATLAVYEEARRAQAGGGQ